MTEYYLLFKWGTLKGWRVPEGECLEILKKAMDGSSVSAMCDHPDDERKDFICQLIDKMGDVGASFQNDWDGNKYTVAQAKQYISEYGK